MVNKSAFTYLGYAVLAFGMALPAHGQPKCHVKETVESQTEGPMPARQNVDIHMEDRKDGRYCVVAYDIPLLERIYTARGEQLVDGLDAMESCKVAEQKANKDMIKQINSTRINTLSVMKCDEEENTVWEAKIGAVADKAKFRRDPERPKEFAYNGQACFWFRDVEWKGHLNPFNGVACQLHDDQYVVVDKF